MINSKGFSIGDTTLRNLEAQVQKNKEDIAEHKRITQVLADWGIRVIGLVASADELPDPLTYGGEYGDAYAVGANEPYDYYIFTRPDFNAGHPDKWWMNVGGLTIQGPAGPVGPRGPQGERGQADKWFITGVEPAETVSSDYVLAYNTVTGTVYRRSGTHWLSQGSLKGPQGPRGLQGETGPQGPRGATGPRGEAGTPGSAVKIINILNSVEELPDPTTVERNAAYIVKTDNVNDVYIITGTDTLVWKNAGVFSGGTIVTDNLGTPIATLDIDDYVKLPNMGEQYMPQALVWDPVEQKVTNITVSDYPDGAPSIVRKDAWGQIPMSYWPGMPGWSNSNLINADYLIQNGYSKNPAISEVELNASPNHESIAVYYQEDPYAPNYYPTSVKYIPIMQDIRSDAVVQRTGGGHIPVPTLDTYNGNLTYAMSIKTAGLHFQRKLYRHHKVLTATTNAGLYINIHWDQYLITSTPESREGGGTILLTQNDLPEITATGVYQSATGFMATITGIQPDATNLTFTGLGVFSTGNATIIDPTGTIGIFTAFPTYADIGYNWTITDTVTPL